MRIFWAMVAVMMLAAVYLFWQSGSGDAEETTATTPATPTRSVDQPSNPAVGSTHSENAATQPVANSDHSTATAPSGTAADLAADLMSSAEQRTQNGSSVINADPPAAPPMGGPHTGHQQPQAPMQPPPPPKDGKVAAGPLKIAKNEDGSVTLDDRFVVRGSGTADDPYQIPWDLLVSAAETYQPRQGMTQLPERIQMLHEKHVKITGYLIFPIAQAQADEVLVMMNMWDGCCIGIPPSPYDAMEVKLSTPVAVTARGFMNYAAMTGVLKVDPYIVNDWLLGLYLVEEGKLDYGM